jgi:hypothetical protein
MFNENEVINIAVLLFQYILLSKILLQSQFVKTAYFTLAARIV